MEVSCREDHHQPVEPQRDSAVRRSAVFERFEQEPEAAARFFLAEAERGENLRLHVAAMNTNGARAEFGAVQHQVVRFGAAAGGVGGQLFDILVVHRRERMVRGVPALLFLVPFEHRKIDDPEELEILRDRAACGGRRTSARRADGAGRRPEARSLRGDGLSARQPSRRRAARSSSCGADARAHLRHRVGIIAIQALGIVEHAQAALLAELLELVALPAADAPTFGMRIATSGRPCAVRSPATDPPRNGTAECAGRACRCRRSAWPARR